MTQEELVAKVEKLEKELEITNILLARFARGIGVPLVPWIKFVDSVRKEYEADSTSINHKENN